MTLIINKSESFSQKTISTKCSALFIIETGKRKSVKQKIDKACLMMLWYDGMMLTSK